MDSPGFGLRKPLIGPFERNSSVEVRSVRGRQVSGRNSL